MSRSPPVHKTEQQRISRSEADVPTDLLAGLLMEQSQAPASQPRAADRLTATIYATMAITTFLTFVTLTTGYQMLFARHIFA